MPNQKLSASSNSSNNTNTNTTTTNNIETKQLKRYKQTNKNSSSWFKFLFRQIETLYQFVSWHTKLETPILYISCQVKLTQVNNSYKSANINSLVTRRRRLSTKIDQQTIDFKTINF